MLNIVHYLLNISPTHIHPYHNATLRRITVNLQRTVHQVNGSHLADGYLYTIRSAHKELVKIQVLHFIIIQPEHKVETTFILKNHSGTLARISRADNGIQLFDIDTVTGYFRTVILYHQLGQSHGLLHNYIGSTGNLLHKPGNFLCFTIKFLHVLSIKFDSNVCFCSRHQFVEAKLDGLRKIEFGTVRKRFKGSFHLLHHLCAARSAGPFLKRFHHNHHIGIFHRHRVCRHLCRTNLGNHVSDFGELLLQDVFRQTGHFNAFGQRTTRRKCHLHGKITFVQSRDKLCPKLSE